jgi:hypothetical protein
VASVRDKRRRRIPHSSLGRQYVFSRDQVTNDCPVRE